jgi:hypothetical protein
MNNFTSPRWFSLLFNCLCRSLWFYHIMTFFWYYINDCICICNFGSYIFLIMNIIYMAMSRSIKGCILIEGNISTRLNLFMTRDVNSVCLQYLAVSEKDTLLARRVQLGSLVLGDMYIHWTTEYSYMDDLCIFTCKPIFWCLVPMYSMRTFVLHI